jgi:hypothetical protein
MTTIDFYPRGRLARVVGLREVSNGYREYRFSWGELTFRPWLGLWYSVYHDDAHLGIGFGPGALFLKLPMWIEQRPGTEDWNATYGFSIHRHGLHLNWRDKAKVLDWPWGTTWMKTEILSYGGVSVWEETVQDQRDRLRTTSPEKSLARWTAKHEKEKAVAAKHSKVFLYRYTLLSGEVQEREATVHVKRMTWGWPRLGLPLRSVKSIEVEFSDEVGERTGSWKGGTIGCGYEMRPGETPALCLRRMERERTFR